MFGSNTQGAHGKGAAKDAVLGYGAHYGVAEGVSGCSYAIPTRDYISKYSVVTLPLVEIAKAVARFVQFTHEHPGRVFFVTALGTGLAGYAHHEIAPLFKGAVQCWFPQEWKQYLI